MERPKIVQKIYTYNHETYSENSLDNIIDKLDDSFIQKLDTSKETIKQEIYGSIN